MTFYLFHPLPLVFGRKLFVCNQAFQQLVQGGLGPYRLLFLSFRPADLFTKSWRGAEICIRSSIFDLKKEIKLLLLKLLKCRTLLSEGLLLPTSPSCNLIRPEKQILFMYSIQDDGSLKFHLQNPFMLSALFSVWDV